MTDLLWGDDDDDDGRYQLLLYLTPLVLSFCFIMLLVASILAATAGGGVLSCRLRRATSLWCSEHTGKRLGSVVGGPPHPVEV